jgi:hypothetical protein
MSVINKNIIVGPGDLYVADTLTTELPVLTDGAETIRQALDLDAAWRHLGATDGGVDLAYEPTYSDVPIDQYKDAARLFLESETYSVSTNLMEATLANLAVAWGKDAGQNVTVLTAQADGRVGEFTMGVGTEDPCEYKFVIVSKAPRTQTGCAADTLVERAYIANRVVSVSGANINMSRTGATMFPVSLRLLPSDIVAEVGQEYGLIFDRDASTVTP